jgi:FolB domain-containing protein
MTAGIDKLDKIHIRDLQIRCIIGINEEERLKKQDVLINITLYADLSKAGKTDSIEDTVDYKSIKNQVIDMVEKSSCLLLEHLAERIAQICLDDKRIKRTVITVDKPGALRFARSVAVEIIREQQNGG